MFKRVAVFLWCTTLFVGLAAQVALAAPAGWAVAQLSSGTGASTRPLVSGDRVIWWDSAGGTRLLTWKSGLTTPLAIVDASRSSSIDGDRVAWFSFAGGGSVRTWSQASGFATITAADNPAWGGTQVSGDRVVWADTDAGVTDSIFTWRQGDLAPTKLSTGAYQKYDPVVSGDRVAWYESDGSAYQIFTRAVGDAGPLQLTHTSLTVGSPKVSGDRVVWFQQTSDGGGDLFTWTPTSTVTTVGPCTNASTYAVSGDRIAYNVWVEGSDGSVPQIVMWTPSGVTTVTAGDDNHMEPDVSGDRLVWLDNSTVMTWKVGESAPTSLTPATGSRDNVHVSGDRVVWQGTGSGGVTQIFTAVPATTVPTTLKVLGGARVRVGRTYTLSGSIAPATASGRVGIVFKRYYRKAWRTVGTTKYATLSGGRYTYKYRPTTAGSWRAYVSYGGTTVGATIYTAAKTVYRGFKAY